jgi:hypothetical protein
MANRTKSFLSRVSIFGVLALGACAAEDEQTARFSEASSRELSAVLTAVSMADNAILMPAIATLDNLFSQGDCPEITATRIIGNGCEMPDGSRYDGSIEIGPAVAGSFASMTFRSFGRVDKDLESLYLDGTLTFAKEGDGELRYDLDMRVETQAGFAADVYWAVANTSAICRLQDETSASCTLRDSSRASVGNVGTFTIEGTQPLGFPGEEGVASSGLDLTLRGAETMHLEFEPGQGCATYIIDDGERQSLCD